MQRSKCLISGLVMVLLCALCSSASGQMLPKVDNFIFLSDASGSMRADYLDFEQPKFELSKQAMMAMNEEIPELGYQSGLYTAATGFAAFQAMSEYNSDSFAQAIAQVPMPPKMYGYQTPLGQNLSKLEPVLRDLSGQTAVILFTDGGDNLGGEPAQVIERLSSQYDTCFHLISYAQDAEEKEHINAMANARDCTVLVSGSEIMNASQMESFVHRVLYTKVSDSDGDGVYDPDDECPGTPAGVEVDQVGCPVDSDQDGVPDYQDLCPDTPLGAEINAQGCPDSDGDGVYDNVDQCPNTQAGAEVDDVGCPFPVHKSIEVHFEFDKAVVQDKYHDELRKVAEYLERNPGTDVVIEGHTDSIGPAEYNMQLSQRRADSVKEYLVEKFGIDTNRMETKGYGESRPVADNASREGRQQNRRVVAVVSK